MLPLAEIDVFSLRIYRFGRFFSYDLELKTDSNNFEQHLLYPLDFFKTLQHSKIQESFCDKVDLTETEADLRYNIKLKEIIHRFSSGSELTSQEQEFIDTITFLFKEKFPGLQKELCESYKESFLFGFENKDAGEEETRKNIAMVAKVCLAVTGFLVSLAVLSEGVAGLRDSELYVVLASLPLLFAFMASVIMFSSTTEYIRVHRTGIEILRRRRGRDISIRFLLFDSQSGTEDLENGVLKITGYYRSVKIFPEMYRQKLKDVLAEFKQRRVETGWKVSEDSFPVER